MNINSIKAIIKKELRGFFDHPIGYILLAVFLGLGNFFFFKQAFISGEASVRIFFELSPWFFLFLIPAATMKAFASEQKEGTIETVLSQPISEIELLIGKFLGNWLFVLIALGFTLIIPLSLSLGGKLDYGIVFAQYTGAIFLSAAMVAIGLLSSTLSKNQTISFISALFITFALIIIGLDVVVLSIPYPLNEILSELSILDHFYNITRGVIDVRDIVYFLSLNFIALSITYLIFMSRKLNRKAKKYKTLQTGIALMVAIAIVANLFGAFISFRVDFTEQKLYSLSKGTLSVLDDVDDAITVKLFASKQLPTQISLVYRDVKDTLLDYKNASKGKVQFVQKFPDENEKAAEEAQSAGIQPVRFNIIKSDEYQEKEGYLGVAISFGDKKEAIPFIQDTSDLEYKLTSLIRKASKKSQQKIIFTKGHDEKDAAQDYQALNEELSKSYEIDSADKKDLAKKLKSADIAIVAGPKKKFDKKEQEALTDFLNDGKSVLLLIDTVDINTQYLMANPNKESFAGFSEQFGVKVNTDLVYDTEYNQKIPVPTGEGMSVIVDYPFFPRLITNPDHIITNRLKEVTIPWASSVELVKGKLGKAKYEPLVQTSEKGGHQTSNFNVSPDSKTSGISDKNLKRYSLGYALSKVGEKEKGRLVVLGDSDFLTNEQVSQNPQAAGLILNGIDWLGQDEILIGIRSKNADPRPLKFESDAVKNFVRYFNMIGLVLLIVVFGLFRMNKRRKLSQGAYVG